MLGRRKGTQCLDVKNTEWRVKLSDSVCYYELVFYWVLCFVSLKHVFLLCIKDSSLALNTQFDFNYNIAGTDTT